MNHLKTPEDSCDALDSKYVLVILVIIASYLYKLVLFWSGLWKLETRSYLYVLVKK